MSEKIYLPQDGLLTYTLTTDPSPLQISPAPDDPSMGSLMISVSSNQTVYVEKIIFSFDIGEGDEYLTDVGSGILCSASPSTSWQIDYENNGNQAVFIATLISGNPYESSGQGGPTFTIYDIQVSEEAGAATLNITETSSTTNENYQDRSTQILIPKAPAHFYVRDFACRSTDLSAGDQAMLCWEGTQDADTKYTIYWEDQSQDVTGSRSWQTPQIWDTTMFILKVDRQYQGETFTKYLSLTVAVESPSITAGELTVNNADGDSAQIMGNLIVSGTGFVGGLLTVNNLKVNFDSTFNTIDQLSTNNITTTSITVNGQSTISSIQVNSTAAFSGPVTIYSTFQLVELSNTNVLASLGSNTNGGQFVINNSSGTEALILSADDNGNGFLVIKDNTDNGNDIKLGVNDSSQVSEITLGDTTITSKSISASSKHFVLPNPRQAGTEIWYACVEGPEAAAYLRGTAQLVNGQALVELPQHFLDVACDQMTTILLTPLSADSLGLAVVEKSTERFQVRELHKGSGTYRFDWEIKAVRRGMENYQVIRPKEEL
jgi:hypothetical protein